MTGIKDPRGKEGKERERERERKEGRVAGEQRRCRTVDDFTRTVF